MQHKVGRRDATPDLLLKHPMKIAATYIWRQFKHLKHASETIEKKHLKHTWKTMATLRNIHIKHMQRMCET
jgi:hypothetical protein